MLSLTDENFVSWSKNDCLKYFFWNYDENILFGGTDVPACEGCEEGGEARHEEQVVGGVVGEAEHGGGQQHDHHHRDAVQGLQSEDIC